MLFISEKDTGFWKALRMRGSRGQVPTSGLSLREKGIGREMEGMGEVRARQLAGEGQDLRPLGEEGCEP